MVEPIKNNNIKMREDKKIIKNGAYITFDKNFIKKQKDFNLFLEELEGLIVKYDMNNNILFHIKRKNIFE
jgi:hypothetical protein